MFKVFVRTTSTLRGCWPVIVGSIAVSAGASSSTCFKSEFFVVSSLALSRSLNCGESLVSGLK